MTLPRQIVYLPLDDIPRAPRNPKGHAIDAIEASIARFGVTIGGIVDTRTDRLIAGHGRLEVLTRMRDRGDDPPEGVLRDPDGTWRVPMVAGWASRSDVEAEGYLVADNRLSEIGGWDERALAEILDDVAEADPDLLAITGYSTEELDQLIAGFGDVEAPGDEGDSPDRGELLALAGVTVGDPQHQVESGQVWILGPHRLVVADVFTGWPLWREMLTGNAIFMPYPSLLAPFTEKAADRPLVMVQPEKYLAGHLLDKWARITGGQPELAPAGIAA